MGASQQLAVTRTHARTRRASRPSSRPSSRQAVALVFSLTDHQCARVLYFLRICVRMFFWNLHSSGFTPQVLPPGACLARGISVAAAYCLIFDRIESLWKFLRRAWKMNTSMFVSLSVSANTIVYTVRPRKLTSVVYVPGEKERLWVLVVVEDES